MQEEKKVMKLVGGTVVGLLVPSKGTYKLLASAASAHNLESQQPREMSDFSFYKTVNTTDKSLHSTYRRGKRSAEATKLKSLQFLSFSEFPGPLSAKALSSPQRSLLIDIWGHLFRRCFDDSVKITAENVNDEVPKLFKEIGYPFPISKSAMLAPGTGHQWPHHLAALSWLCELLIYENEFFFQEEEAADMQAARGDVVGRMFAAAYPQLGKDPQALRAAVLGQLHGMNREAEATQQQLQQQLQQRQQQLAAVEAELRDNASLMESLAAATEAERDSLLLQQKAATEEVQQLGERIKAQGIDKAEVERIRHDVSRLREGLSHRSREVESLSEGLQVLIDKVADDSEKLRIAGQSVNECLSSMSQLAVSAKLPTAEDWSALPKMETAVAAAPAAAAACDIKRATNEILGLDWQELKKGMQKIMQQEVTAKEETHQQRQRGIREIEKTKKAIKDLLANRKTLEKRMQLVQDDLQQLQQQQQAEQQQLVEAERQHLEGVRETKQQYQQQQQQLQRLVQQQQQLLEQEERQQQQQAAAAMEALQQQQQQALQQKELLLLQLRSLTATKTAECAALEQQLSELTEALGHPSLEDKSSL
ncbi:HEC/Ndc80p family protein, putative [Eimeria acervulina]|uniref:Kinetochore protein NDC80 n=1 Tax=Eimeria acervulina TaxID=5801 RepID=U6GUV5_EIMAC|nr:HEC/Ndc80p family protein, putative [Eimeria acervulina]CDI83975.1 HEC/Ndc80p family protein, putative [Eimeria acervulina]